SKAVIDRLIDVSIKSANTPDWFDLGEIVSGVLAMTGVTAATPAAVIAALPAWARPQLTAASVDGFVDLDKAPLLFYDDITRVRDANAMAREHDPTGVDLAELRACWATARDARDRVYLNPVRFRAGTLAGDDAFKCLRAAFPLRSLALV